VENIQAPNKKGAPRLKKPKHQSDFLSFDRAFFMFVRTGGIVLWNRSRSMLNNGHRPSEVALKLHEDFGVQLSWQCQDYDDTSQDDDLLRFFATLVIPHDAVAAPCIFDNCWGRA
jgi:hypothetical protein